LASVSSAHGWIARTHAHALHTINHLAPLPRRIRLVSIAGRDAHGLATAARELGFERWTTSWEELVEDVEVEVVAVVAAIPAHAPVSIATAKLGKHVLCEKPVGANADESQEMLAAVEKAGVTHACGFNYRFVPAVALIRRLVQSGRLGEPRHYRTLYLQDFVAATRNIPESGAVGDYSHLPDMLLHLGGEPISVSARTTHFHSDAEDAYVASIELRGGALASLEASRVAAGRKGRQAIELNGSEGSVWWDMEDLNRLHVFLARDEAEGLGGFRDVLVTEPDHPYLESWWTPGHVLGWEASFVHQWRSFLEAVLGGRPLPEEHASFEDGCRAAVLSDAILSSAKEGRCIELERGEATTT